MEAAKHRYRIFKESTWDALQSLREIFFYHLVNAQGSVAEVEQNILKELQYQSSLELEPATFEMVRDIPLAHEIVVHARQELVRRLDGYARENRELFGKVVTLIQTKFIPIIQRHAISGRAVINNEDEVLADPVALGMLIDVFSDRGYHAVVDKQLTKDPRAGQRAHGRNRVPPQHDLPDPDLLRGLGDPPGRPLSEPEGAPDRGFPTRSGSRSPRSW